MEGLSGGGGRKRRRGRDRMEICGNLEDIWKRKREKLERSREEEEIFRKSKKIERS